MNHPERSPTPPNNVPRRKYARMLVVLGSPLLLAAVVGLWGWQQSRTLHAKLTQLEADGYLLKLEDLEKAYPRVPDAENMAVGLKVATDQMPQFANFGHGLLKQYGPLRKLLSRDLRAAETNLTPALRVELGRFLTNYSGGYPESARGTGA